MIKTISDILADANTIIGENNSDNALEFIGNLSDTLNSFSDSEERIKTLEQEKSELDSSWRKKYRERFFSPASEQEQEDPANDNDTPLKTKFEELFS